MTETLIEIGTSMLWIFAIGVVLAVVHWVLIKRHSDYGNGRLFSRQLFMIGLSIVALLSVVFALPINDSSRNQLLALMGILLSGIFALSSTTVISNLMAGLLLRMTKPFKVGDFIRIGEHFGRVSERGLFDTEIQTETRELIALPNVYCISNPVTTTRSSGTIISASLSLGYDLDHRKIEPLLLKAAENCGLADPFVHILELGNFSITYRVSGFLEEPKRLISVRSGLYASVLDVLHGNGIEIMSPSFMAQRKVAENAKIMPSIPKARAPKNVETTAEDLAFDKAEQAEQLANEKREIYKKIEELEALIKEATDEDEKATMKATLKEVQEQLKALADSSKPEEESTNADTKDETKSTNKNN